MSEQVHVPRFLEVLTVERVRDSYCLIVGRSDRLKPLEDEAENHAVIGELDALVARRGTVVLQSFLDSQPITIAGAIVSAEHGMRAGRFIIRVDPIEIEGWDSAKQRRAYLNRPALMIVGWELAALLKVRQSTHAAAR